MVQQYKYRSAKKTLILLVSWENEFNLKTIEYSDVIKL